MTEEGSRALLGWDKVGEIAHQLPSQAKQIQHQINSMY